MAQKKKHWAKSLSDAINLGTTIAAAVAIGCLGGRWLDAKLATDPWLTVVGCLLGVATAMKVMWERVAGRNSSRESNHK
ncbi:MAG: AtpZ/AtpI family protein [Syntrophomonadaceae bacterium]|jgi:ATP synthase protein I